jgi:alpha-tubulin suppressor-like RCC1 family protein
MGSRRELGYGTTINKVFFFGSQSGGASTKAVQVSAGQNWFAALTSTGHVFTWGLASNDNRMGQNTAQTIANPKLLSSIPKPMAEVSAGTVYGMARSVDGSVYAWGDCSLNRCGFATVVGQLAVPTVVTGSPINGTSLIRQLICGVDFSLAVLQDGYVRAFGRNNVGQLGQGDIATYSTGTVQVKIPGLSRGTSSPEVSNAAVSSTHALAVDGAGVVWCWGSNSGNQCGSAASPVTTPVSVTLPSGLTAVSVAAGSSYSVIIASNGLAYGVGSNNAGALGMVRILFFFNF